MVSARNNLQTWKRWLLLGSALTAASLVPVMAHAGAALPTGGKYVAGAGTIGGTGSSLVVDQTSKTGIVNWNSFSIGQGGSVQFNNGSGATLNRVTGGSLSEIAGSLSATGSLYLINPQGVVINGTGKVLTGGSFVASTLDVSDTAFMDGGSLQFIGGSTGSVVNQGNIAAGGDAVLIGASVRNEGSLVAGGTAGMAAGDDVLLQKVGDEHLYVKSGTGDVTNTGVVSAASAELRAAGGNVYALAGNNGGAINATGVATVRGHVWLTSNAGTVDISGTVSAQNADGSGGTITATADDISVSGLLDASATADGAGGTVNAIAVDTAQITGTILAVGGQGGAIETSGRVLSIDGATIDAGQGGQWLLDPYDLTVDTAAATTINGTLGAGTSVTLQTNLGSASGPGVQNASGNGDIVINSTLNWSTKAKLTLSAYRDIAINANVTASGGGALSLTTGTGGSGDYLIASGKSISFTGGSGAGASLSINGNPYTLLYSVADMQNINASASALQGRYALAKTLNASSTSNWVPIGTDGLGNIGNSGTGFSGVFAGLGHSISNLTVDIGTNSYAGVFGYNTGTIRNVGLEGGSVRGGSYVGGLVGQSYHGTISGTYATGAISASSYVGGLVGVSFDNTITDSYATGAVSGVDSIAVGGLIGKASSTMITGSYATGAVSGDSDVGGLVGFVSSGTITGSYATGTVRGGIDVGGLVGANFGTITGSYATGSVRGSRSAGGLVGLSSDYSTITGSHATGAVSGGTQVGGLVGTNNYHATINDAYAIGPVDGSNYVGGLVGFNSYSTITGSYATGALNGVSYVGGLVGVSYYGTIANSYAMGAVRVGSGVYFGGLVGYNSGTITDAYATGAIIGGGVISGGSAIGGLVGANQGAVTNGYWDIQTSGQSTSAGGTGLTTAQLQGTLPGGFSSSVWGTGSGLYPYFLWQYPTKPQAISGFAYNADGTAAAIAEVNIYKNGSLLGGPASSGANGYFYEVVAGGTVRSSTKLGETVTLPGYPSVSGLTYTYRPTLISGNVTGFNVTFGQINEFTSQSKLSALNADISATFGSNYAGIASQLAGVSEWINATGPFAVDTTLSHSSAINIKSGGNISITALIDAGTNTLRLTANGTITESGAGAIQAGILTGSANGAVTLNGTNKIAALASFSDAASGVTFSLKDGQALSITGPLNINNGTIALSTMGSVTVAGTITAKILTLVSAVQALETTAGAIKVGTINVTAQTGINLNSTLNEITTIGTDKTVSGTNIITK